MRQLFINPPTLAPLAEHYRDRLDNLGLPYQFNERGRVLTEDELFAQAECATAIVAGLEKLDARFFERAKTLRTIAKYGVGYDNIDLDAARSRGIRVTRTLGSNTQAVADCALSAMLALLHRLPQRHAEILSGAWKRQPHAELGGLTIAIIGFGRIGSRMARHAKHFGWHVIAVDPAKHNVEELQDADELCSLEQAISRADIVSLHYPRNGGAFDFDERMFRMMQSHAIFVNMARGGMVDEHALARVLRSGHLGGAALDVFIEEPITDLSPWHGLPNVLLTPHIAGSSDAALRTGFEMCIETIEYSLGLRAEEPRASFL